MGNSSFSLIKLFKHTGLRNDKFNCVLPVPSLCKNQVRIIGFYMSSVVLYQAKSLHKLLCFFYGRKNNSPMVRPYDMFS